MNDDLKITMKAQYTHSVEDRYGDYDVYDCFLVRETTTPCLYGGVYNIKTLYVKGYGQSSSLSRRQNGNNLTPPTVTDVLSMLLSDAMGIDSTDSFIEWVREYHADAPIHDAEKLMEVYRQQRRSRDELADFLDSEAFYAISQEIEEP